MPWIVVEIDGQSEMIFTDEPIGPAEWTDGLFWPLGGHSTPASLHTIFEPLPEGYPERLLTELRVQTLYEARKRLYL